MKEQIAEIASLVFYIAISVALISATVEDVAKGKALSAAIFSPLAVMAVIATALNVADYFGWLDV